MIYRFLVIVLFLLYLVAAETPHRRSYLYVGGQYTLNSDWEHLFTDQMYVERLTPMDGPFQPHPIVFIHGTDQTATNWLNKPDGGDGWASYFLSLGYECYLVDQTFRGRSPWQYQNGKPRKYSAEHLSKYFTATQRYSLWPQAEYHTQWPGSGIMGDPIFDRYYASTVPSLEDNVAQESSMQATGAALLDHIGTPVVLVSHSQGGLMGWGIADQRPDLVHSIIAIEPAGPPFQNALFGSGPARPYGLTDIRLAYYPPVQNPETDFIKQTVPPSSSSRSECTLQADYPTPRQLVNLSRIPVLLVTTEASYHAGYDWCTVRFLRQAGVQTEHLQLGEVGIHGNGHMVFLEKNSDDVAKVIDDWILESTLQGHDSL